jgi:hypothetical protein
MPSSSDVGANANLNKKNKNKRPKRSGGIFSGPSLAYAKRKKKTKCKSTPPSVPSHEPVSHFPFIMPLEIISSYAHTMFTCPVLYHRAPVFLPA